FYCRNIALQYGLENITDKVFLSGLLHDLGKIILLSTNSELSNWISDITMNREIRTTTIIEEISIGVSHSSIGELIADKWRMPEYLIESIKYHHSPLDASKEYKEVVYITYLANMLCGIEENRYDFLFLEEDVLNMFKFTSEEKFQKLHNNLKNKYNTSVE
ncbi:MAG: HDOD domain-containing protein, partial [Spirochaetota bacterium]|nr:HDOD domain-containing protein [Spirochaetota bacterium]